VNLSVFFHDKDDKNQFVASVQGQVCVIHKDSTPTSIPIGGENTVHETTTQKLLQLGLSDSTQVRHLVLKIQHFLTAFSSGQLK